MPFLPGLVAMPTTLLNAALGLAADRSLAVRGPDRLAVVSPMFEEEAGAGPALASLLRQWHPVDEIAISINGGRDRTAGVVAATLRAAGYELVERPTLHHLGATMERWSRSAGGPRVTVLDHAQPTSKADSINTLVTGWYVESERILVVDGDTRFDPAFVHHLRDAFYRLRVESVGGRRRYVLEDVALQSGAVDSLRPGPGRPAAALISRARSAEYALAALLRRGQTRRVGQGAVFGRSRLYTAVGCGFATRRDAFPMPADTSTEDHDFTLTVQGDDREERGVDVDTLHHRGFRIVVDGHEVSPRAFFDRHDEIVLRRGADARFVTEAVMYTEDPPGVGGYLRQVERWIGGGIENTLKRLFVPGAWRRLGPNVRFTVLAAQLENLLGLLLLLLLPASLGLYVALPGIGGLSLAGVGAWLVLDLSATLALVSLGLHGLERARGYRGRRLRRRVVACVATTVPPLLLLKFLNALCFLLAASRVVPAFLRRDRSPWTETGVWVRPRAATRSPTAHVRVASVAAGMLLTGIGTFLGVAQLASLALPDYREAWHLMNAEPRVDQDDHRDLPLSAGPAVRDEAPSGGAPPGGPVRLLTPVALATLPIGIDRQGRSPSHDAEPAAASPSPVAPTPGGGGGAGTAGAAGTAGGAGEPPSAAEAVSRYCRPGYVDRSAPTPRSLAAGADAGDYRPLSPWGLMTLARLAPLAAHLEEAATAYDVDARLLLKVLLNESYLDPLAVGPTGDLGLSQVTSDALTMLRSLSDDPASPFANPRLFASTFSVFDPDFSLCAGAAKLAWARAQPHGEDEAVAYARYVNPLHGVVRGRVSDRHVPLVDALQELTPLVEALSLTVAAYREDPALVTAAERALLDVARDVRAGAIGLPTAYRRTAALVAEHGIDDAPLYRTVIDRLFGGPEEAQGDGARVAGG